MADWYYAQNNEQKGPVSERELLALEKAGLLLQSTLVWKKNLPNWQPWSGVAADVRAAASAEGGAVEEIAVCAYSGQALPLSQMVRYGDHWVAAAHKDAFVQSLLEGARVQGMSGSGELQCVGFWWRALGAVIDWAVKLVPSMLVYVPYYILSFQSMLENGAANPSPNPMDQFKGMGGLAIGAYVLGIAGQLAIAIFYDTWMGGKYGGTVGKIALGFKIVRADGEKLTYARAFGRWAAKLVSYFMWWLPVGVIFALSMGAAVIAASGTFDAEPAGLLIGLAIACVWALIGGFGYYMVGWTKRKQGLHDKIASTIVVRKNPY